MMSPRIRAFPKSASRDSRFKRRPMRSPRYGRDEDERVSAREQGWCKDGFSEEVWSFLRDRLGPDDLEELARLLQSGDEDLGGMVEEDEAGPPYYGRYGANVHGPLDLSSKSKRFQGGFQGASTGSFGATDARLRTPSARDAAAFYARFPDAARLR